jgi:DHA2 family multidrug resistance protein
MVLITEDITIRDIAWIASLVHIVRTVGTAVGLWGRDRSWAEL